jgi:hypothetical protein
MNKLIEFPGKRKLIHRIVANPRVLNAINRIRNKAQKLPLLTNPSTALPLRSVIDHLLGERCRFFNRRRANIPIDPFSRSGLG